MKNKETLIGSVLIMALVMGFLYYESTKAIKKQAEDKSKKEVVEKQKQPQISAAPVSDTSSAAASSSVATAVADSTALTSQFGVFAKAATGEEKFFTVENEVQKIVFTNRGGQIKSIELKKYKTWDKKPLILFTDSTNSLSYQFVIQDNQVIDTKDFYFEPVGESFKISGDSAKQAFAMRLNVGDGKYMEQKFTLRGNSYLIDYDLNFTGFDSIFPSNTTYISANWHNKLSNLEHNIENERRYSAVYFKYKASDVEHLNEDDEADSIVVAAPLEWISYKQQFFTTTLFSKDEFQHAKLRSSYIRDDHSYAKDYDSRFTLPYKKAGTASYSMQYYIGPNSYNTLAKMDKEVESIIKLGPDFWMFSWIKYITRFIIWVFSWFNKVNLNYGIIILLMTIILKIALHPLTAKSIESSAKMKILAPEIAALKEKYGDDQGKIGQEQMKIYQKAGVSPLGGCLPLLLQMPILMAMYYFFPASIELRQEPFLWAADLSSYDAIVTFKTAVWGIGDHISLFTILMTLTSIGQAVMNNQLNAMSNQQPGLKYMPYFMPVLLMFMFNSFPAALTYYYLLQNLLGMGHQWVIQKFFIDETKLRHQIEENKKNPKPASSWQKKLSDLQKKAEQQKKQGAKVKK